MVLIELWMGIIEQGEDKQLLSAGLPSFRYGTESHAAARGPFLSFFLSLQNCLHWRCREWRQEWNIPSFPDDTVMFPEREYISPSSRRPPIKPTGHCMRRRIVQWHGPSMTQLREDDGDEQSRQQKKKAVALNCCAFSGRIDPLHSADTYWY
jgi:hypothetical protein